MGNEQGRDMPLDPCKFCGCSDIRHDHPSRAPRVYCSLCRATAESPLQWNSRPEDWTEDGGLLVQQILDRFTPTPTENTNHD